VVFLKIDFHRLLSNFLLVRIVFLKNYYLFQKNHIILISIKYGTFPKSRGGGWKTVNHVMRAFEETPVCVHPAPEKSNYLSAKGGFYVSTRYAVFFIE